MGATIDHGDADRGAHIDAMSADDERRADRSEDPFGYCLQRIRVGSAGHDNSELVAAQAGNEIVLAHDLAQPPGDVENELIANMMTERVVDVLEVIEVDVKHRRTGAAVAHLGDSALQPFREINAVG